MYNEFPSNTRSTIAHGCLFNVTDAASAGTSSKVGFHGAPPAARRANANQAAATDLATVIAPANELRAALVEKGLIKG